jgi:hypothetical protein
MAIRTVMGMFSMRRVAEGKLGKTDMPPEVAMRTDATSNDFVGVDRCATAVSETA